MKRYVRGILAAACALLVLLLASVAGVAWWFSRGPGFRRECDRLAATAAIRPGMTVADVGAGSGRIAVSIAARLGPSGRLYATELSEVRLREIRKRVAAEGLTNLIPIQAGVSTTGLPNDCCDVIYMRRVYHHLTDPVAIAAGLYSALRSGGRLVVIDMLTPQWLPDFLQHGISSEAIRGGLESAGFLFERHVDWRSPIDYCLVFRKAARHD